MLKIIFAVVLLLSAVMGAITVLSKRVVTDCGMEQGDVGVWSPVTSAEEVMVYYQSPCHMKSLQIVVHCYTMWCDASSCISYIKKWFTVTQCGVMLLVFLASKSGLAL